MPEVAEAIVLAVFTLATSVWIGGYVAIALIARTAAATVDPGSQVAFFRSLGRSYLWIGLPALVVAMAAGGVLTRDRDWDALLVVTVMVAAALLLSFAVTVVQARRMTVLRRSLIGSPDNEHLSEQVRRGARLAGALRAVLGLLSVALVVLGAFLAT